jgi:hypothetical protein
MNSSNLKELHGMALVHEALLIARKGYIISYAVYGIALMKLLAILRGCMRPNDEFWIQIRQRQQLQRR